MKTYYSVFNKTSPWHQGTIVSVNANSKKEAAKKIGKPVSWIVGSKSEAEDWAKPVAKDKPIRWKGKISVLKS